LDCKSKFWLKIKIIASEQNLKQNLNQTFRLKLKFSFKIKICVKNIKFPHNRNFSLGSEFPHNRNFSQASECLTKNRNSRKITKFAQTQP